MSKPLLIGVTGGMGSGKSLVTRIFSTLGVPVYDADSRAKALMTTDGILIQQIKKEFRNLSYDAQGRLNRQYLASEVFNNTTRLKKLNEMVHPRVGVDFETWVESNKESDYLVKEAALLFESGSYKSLDKIIVVTAPADLRVKRVLSRDPQRTESEVLRIMSNQLSEEEKVSKADFIIRNDETTLIIPQILALHELFVKKPSSVKS